MSRALTSSEVRRAAIVYARLGYGVFPCKEGSKEPDTRHGFKDGTTDPLRIREVFRPSHNIGLIAPEQVLVIDFDVSKDDRVPLAQRKADTRQRLLMLQDTFEEVEAAPLHVTPSHGFHIFLALAEGTSRLITGPWPRGATVTYGDLRGMGRAYVVAPPSCTSRGAYTVVHPLVAVQCLPVASTSLLEYLSPPERKRTSRQTPAGMADTATFARQVAAARSAPEGNRNNTLNRSSFIVGLLVAAGKVTEEDAREELKQAGQDAGLGPREALATVASGLRAGIREGHRA